MAKAKKKSEVIAESGGDDLFSLLENSTGKDVFAAELYATAASPSEEISPTVAQRRKEILDASLKIFARKGFDGSRTKEIAAEAGVSEATVFKYFPTKRHLFLNILRPVIESIAKPFFIQPMTKIIAQAATIGLEDCLVQIMEDRFALMLKNERLIRTLVMEMGRQQEMLAVFQQLLIPIIRSEIATLFQGAQERGEIDADIRAEVFARNLLSTIIGNIILLTIAPEQFGSRDRSIEIRETIRVFVNGIKGAKA